MRVKIRDLTWAEWYLQFSKFTQLLIFFPFNITVDFSKMNQPTSNITSKKTKREKKCTNINLIIITTNYFKIKSKKKNSKWT